MSRTSRVALAAATVPLALAALSVPASASSFDAPTSQSQDIVSGTGHRYRMIGSTPYPIVDTGKVARRQTVQFSKARSARNRSKIMRVPGAPLTAMIVKSATFHYRYNDTPQPRRAVIDIVNTVEITSTGTAKQLGLSATLQSKMQFVNGKTSGSPICKGDTKFNGLCIATINLGDSNGDRDPGETQAVGDSGCKITGKTATIRCVTTNYDTTAGGANLRANTKVKNVQTRVQLKKGSSLGSTIKINVRPSKLGRKRVVPTS